MVGGVKQLLLIFAVVALVGCHAGNKKNASKAKAIADWKVIDAAIRYELTKVDLEKVTELNLTGNQLISVKELEKLTELENLHLNSNPDLTKAQISELQKALPECYIYSDPTK